ncbi:hypothetical protein [Peribacillus simplex]|uniref:hypothetical protein n=1 Tax=Peribacillus simplex TaxID=1478 RepID=UPI003CFA0D3F
MDRKKTTLKELPLEEVLELNFCELLTLGFLIGSTIKEKGAGSLMIKGHYMMGSKIVIFIKGNELESPQVFNEVKTLAFGQQYKGAFSEVVVIGEDQSSRLFTSI